MIFDLRLPQSKNRLSIQQSKHQENQKHDAKIKIGCVQFLRPPRYAVKPKTQRQSRHEKNDCHLSICIPINCIGVKPDPNWLETFR